MKKIEEIKLPQSDVEAEECLVAEVLQGGWTVFDDVEKIIQDDEAFYDHNCKHIWQAFRRLRRDEEEFHIVSISNEAKKKDNRVTQFWISGLPEKSIGKSFAPQHAKIVWEKYVQRRVSKSANKLYNSSYLPIDKTKQVLEEHRRSVDKLRSLLHSKNVDITSITKEEV